MIQSLFPEGLIISMAGLLTFPIFCDLPIRCLTDSGKERQKIMISTWSKTGLQQRVLLPIFTAFPFHPDQFRDTIVISNVVKLFF